MQKRANKQYSQKTIQSEHKKNTYQRVYSYLNVMVAVNFFTCQTGRLFQKTILEKAFTSH